MAAKKRKNKSKGKYQAKPVPVQAQPKEFRLPYVLAALAFFLVEVFAFFFLSLDMENYTPEQLIPLGFGALWAVGIAGLLRLVPGNAGRVVFGIVYFLAAVYAGFQTGYYVLFSEMMWLSDFRYASEGSDYFTVLFSYPIGWWAGVLMMIAAGILLIWKYPVATKKLYPKVLGIALAIAVFVAAFFLPEAVFAKDRDIRYAGSDYGRSQSAEAAYNNMFNTHRLYQVCGLYQTCWKDIYANCIHPLTPSYMQAQKEAKKEIDAYFARREEPSENPMTGLLEGKNVVLVLMESMDDWMIGGYTPTLSRLMKEGIEFTNFYTPVYGGIRTFNTEFCINTGSFLSSQGGYAFDYVTNHYNQSLASQLRQEGYSAKTFHYNDPTFYSRGEFSPAMGYEEYVCYADYVTELSEDEQKNALYDDLLLFDNEALKGEFFREGKPTLNFIITRSAHLSYKYNEVLSYWGLKRYPEFRGLTGNEETDCAYLKAKLVDDLFARLLEALEENGTLENTVIIGVTDHYTYGYKNEEALYELSGVTEPLMLEKTPCFLWSPGLEAQKVDKVLNTSDLLPTVLNLLGVESEYDYIGHDAFDDSYPGFVPFSDGGWISGNTAHDATSGETYPIKGNRMLTQQGQDAVGMAVSEFITINNLLLETDYYQ